jgi:hypothetical protein
MTDEEPMNPEEDLPKALKAFRNVENVRIITSDNAKYLGGWLTPKQRKVVDSGKSLYYDAGMFYQSTSDAPATILKIFDTVGISIKDLRLHYGGFPWTHVLPESLRVLRITQHFKEFAWEFADDAQPLLDALDSMKGLEELDITLAVNFTQMHRTDYDSDLEFLAQDLFKAMEKKPNWMFDQASLCDFVRKHASTLRCLIIWRCVLNGNWLQTLHDLAEITREKLEYLGVMYPRYVSLREPIRDEKFGKGWTKRPPQFSCATDFRGFPLRASVWSDGEDENDDQDDDQDSGSETESSEEASEEEEQEGYEDGENEEHRNEEHSD